MANKSILVFAPHVLFPIRNGADKYIHKKWTSAPDDVYVELIYGDGVYKVENGIFSKIAEFNKNKNKSLETIVKFILSREQYLFHKYKTKDVVDYVEKIQISKFDAVVCSFFSSYDLLKKYIKDDLNCLIESHNFDPKIYFDRALESGFIKRQLYVSAAYRSYKSIVEAKKVNVCALGSADLNMFNSVLSNSSVAFVGGIGCEKYLDRVDFPKENDCILSFVGSLGIQMNNHAIKKFINEKWQKIKERNKNTNLRIIGSSPSKDLIELAGFDPSISVHADVSDDELKFLVQTSCATLIPFESLNGLKLKMFMSIEMGVPFISYKKLTNDDKLSEFSLVSDDSNDIADFLVKASKKYFLRDSEIAFKDFCEKNSWAAHFSKSIHTVL